MMRRLSSIRIFIWCLAASVLAGSVWGGELFQKKNTSALCKENPAINFGVLLHNPYYQISRSKGLGEKGLVSLHKHLRDWQMRFPSKIIYMNDYGYGVPTIHQLVTRDQSLAKYLTEQGELLFGSFRWGVGFNSFFSLEEQEAGLGNGAAAELQNISFEFLHGSNRNVFLDGRNPLGVAPASANFPDGSGGAVHRIGGRDALYQVLKEILTAEGPLLFHCKGGIHRTGMTGLMIRYLQGGIWTEVAPWPGAYGAAFYVGMIPVPRGAKYKNLAQLEYLQHNQVHFREKNLEAVEQVSKEAQFRCLKEKFGPYLNAPSTDPCESDLRQNEWTSQNAQLRKESTYLTGVLGKEDREALWNGCSAL